MKLKVVAGILVVALISNVLVGCSIVLEENADAKNKVHFEGIQVVEGETSTDIADLINNDEKLSTNLIIELDDVYDVELERVEDDISVEEAQTILIEHRKSAKAYYTETNNKILEELDISKFDMEFVADSYAPYITAQFDRDITSNDINNIYELAEADEVTAIYVQNVDKFEDELSEAIDVASGTSIVTSGKYNGEGIKVGILDVGIVKKDNEIFDEADLVIRDEWWYIETEGNHATQMAACVLAVAPKATILSVERSGDIHGEVEWLIDQGANIINISLGLGGDDENGTYTSVSSYCDYIAREYSIVFTGSAGNRGEEDMLVTPPNGYNTITVGACEADGTRWEDSSYEEKFNINFPNFLAPGVDFNFPGYVNYVYSGTSNASAIVAGTVALLMHNASSVMLYPEWVMAIMMATTQRIEEYAVERGFNDEAGTGMLDIQAAVYGATGYHFTVTEDHVGEFVQTAKVYLRKGKRIRIAFVSFVNNGSTQLDNLVTDYDLYLYSGDTDEMVAWSCGTYNNEFIDYEVEESGYYVIKIKQYSKKKTNLSDKCAYSYFIN